MPDTPCSGCGKGIWNESGSVEDWQRMDEHEKECPAFQKQKAALQEERVKRDKENAALAAANKEAATSFKEEADATIAALEAEAAALTGEDIAGFSKAERDEQEKLVVDLMARKKELKEGGMSGGEVNKDEEVVQILNRMHELKEKQDPESQQRAKKLRNEAKKVGQTSEYMDACKVIKGEQPKNGNFAAKTIEAAMAAAATAS